MLRKIETKKFRNLFWKEMIVILVSIIILNHCKENSNTDSQLPLEEITIDENKYANVSFSLKGIVESDFISYPRLAVSPYQNKIILYGVSTTKKEKPKLVTKTYDKSLNFLGEKTFFYGQGPGDVGNNNIISIGKNNLFISENSNFRVSFFSNDWTYQKSIRHKLQIDAFEIYENGNLFISKEYIYLNKKQAVSFMIGSIYEFKINYIFTTDPFFLDIIVGDSKKRLLGGVTTHSWFYKNKEIFILVCGNYRILKFDYKGKKLKDVIVNVDKKRTNHSRDDEYFQDQGFFKMKHFFRFNDTVDPTAAMIPLMKGFIVIRRYDYSTKCNEFAYGDYYSDQLEYIGKVKFPCFYDILTLFTGLRKNESVKFDNGFLYLIQEINDRTIIEKWEVAE